jgi:membrane protein YdbS with pleckstrin-like domain
MFDLIRYDVRRRNGEDKMHCIQCGTTLPDNARFCLKCGAEVYDTEETRIAKQGKQYVERIDEDGDIERVIFVARPTLLFVKIGYVLAALGAIALVALLTFLGTWLLIPWVGLFVGIPLGLALLLIPAFKHIKRNLVRYTVTDSKLEIDEGFISRTTRNVPLSKIQDVTVESGFTQRLLGFGNLIIDNASEEGGKIIIRNIDKPREKADLLLNELRKKR